MSAEKLRVAFLWHQHQPYYKNSAGYYQMPWVRFHSVKDYLDLLLIIKKFPSIKQNINLVPSLLLQIRDYVENNAKDNIGLLAEIPAKDLSVEEKVAILDSFFLANPENMIQPYPRYYELYQIYRNSQHFTVPADRAAEFSTQDFLDLQVWYNLTWVGPVSRESRKIKHLLEKGAQFTESDKNTVMSEHARLMREVIPIHRELWDSKQVELSTSPFFHPILPLLIDHRIALEGKDAVDLPKHHFAHPEDADIQIRHGLDFFERLFDRKPAGIWPPEGAVSNATANLLAAHRLRWMATDESILAASSGSSFKANRIYQTHLYHAKHRSIHIFFRDHNLSDAIGFVYGNWDEDRAVEDFIGRLHGIRKRIMDDAGATALQHHLATIVLDGENCWEHYRENGRVFLEKLYEALSLEPLVETVTFGEFLDSNVETISMRDLSPGSWVNANFDIWIGAAEDNRAWDLLKEARDFIIQKEEEGVLPQATLEKIWRHIYIAEGSDWCWWYGDDHSSAQDAEFDQLFRGHLMKVYELAGEDTPAALYQTIKHRNVDTFSSKRPRGFIKPKIDGRNTYFYEWEGAAVYEGRRTPQETIDQVSRIIEKFYLGFDEKQFYFRIDFATAPQLLYEFVLSVKQPRQIAIVFSPLRSVVEKFETKNETIERVLLEPHFKLREIFEAAIPFTDLDMNEGNLFGFQIQVKMNGKPIEVFPHANIIECEVPGSGYEFREWTI